MSDTNIMTTSLRLANATTVSRDWVYVRYVIRMRLGCAADTDRRQTAGFSLSFFIALNDIKYGELPADGLFDLGYQQNASLKTVVNYASGRMLWITYLKRAAKNTTYWKLTDSIHSLKKANQSNSVQSLCSNFHIYKIDTTPPKIRLDFSSTNCLCVSLNLIANYGPE